MLTKDKNFSPFDYLFYGMCRNCPIYIVWRSKISFYVKPRNNEVISESVINSGKYYAVKQYVDV